MKKLKYIFIWSTLIFGSHVANAQLQNGATAPDFTLMDINGNQHTLYEYLDQGKTVYIDFFACHCPYCWDYHNTHALSDLYDTHGPGTASDDVFVFAIELDANNGTNEFYGISGTTQGNWVAGTNYPQINPESATRSQIISAYNVTYYPLIYAICPDKKITVIGKKNTALLYEHIQSCGLALGLDPATPEDILTVSSSQDQVHVQFIDNQYLHKSVICITDLQGKIVAFSLSEASNVTMDIGHLNTGLYIITLHQGNELVYSGKIQKN